MLRRAVVWDCHNDLAFRVLYEGLDIGRRLPAGLKRRGYCDEAVLKIMGGIFYAYGMRSLNPLGRTVREPLHFCYDIKGTINRSIACSREERKI